MTAHHYNKIILTLMIKNESKIIERCMSNALEHVDAINILDTGSTDETVTICEKYFSWFTIFTYLIIFFYCLIL
jgi:glycosyltransferase involved in cell wall biosynthesis